MSDVIIEADNISKRYVISHQQGKSDGLRHTVERALRSPFQWLKSKPDAPFNTREDFWALRDVSFQIKRGDVVGIVGRNGAGKSTLLKILSRITRPTSGRIRLRGRVASLLEVGTGFHQELSGRENVFLNGAILGMSRAEIRRKFDEIVEFSGVEKFLDTPVKRYSSGMYVRLAFAVAAHLEPEILIVDEVLAVGDSEFQKKCLGKMGEVAKNGRTVLFVSHNISAVTRLCPDAILMEGGRLRAKGPTANVLKEYLNPESDDPGLRTWDLDTKESGDQVFKPISLKIVDTAGRVSGRVETSKAFDIEFDYQIGANAPRIRLTFMLLTHDGVVAFTAADSGHESFDTKSTAAGSYRTRCTIPADLMNEGQYAISAFADVPFKQKVWSSEPALSLYVEQTKGVSSRFPEKWPGVVCPKLQWATTPVS